jgi:hypothetical protein
VEELKLSPATPPTVMKVKFGQAVFGTFRVYRQQPGGKPTLLHKGSSDQPVQDLPLDANSLTGNFLMWHLIMTATTPPAPYAAHVTIAHHGNVVLDEAYEGKIGKAGQLAADEEDNPVIIVDLRKITS